MSEIAKEKINVEELSEEYFCNDGAKIRRMSNSILKKIGHAPCYPDEFYSLAGEVFLQTVESWDGTRKFESFLYSCLSNRFKSLMSRENAQKRGGQDKPEVSLSTEIGEDLLLEDTIGKEQVIDCLSPEMIEYLNTLKPVQKQIYLLLTEGYEPNEIQKKLNLTPKVYRREMRDARAYDKIKILNFKIHRRNHNSEASNTKTSQEEEKGAEIMSQAVTNERTDVMKTVSMLIEDVADGTLRDDNPLQRATDNWNLEMKGNLIVTCLNGFGIPEFVICERKVGDTYVKEIIDGLQRFSAFSGYVAGGYRISKKVERPLVSYKVWKEDENGQKMVEDGLPVYEDRVFDVRGKKFADLPRELQKKIEGYGIHCDTYLKCTNEDVEYHIRRLNSSRSMNHSQRGLTFIGSTLAAVVKEISNKSFFRDTYKVTDFRNGNIQRLISESAMLINFADDWVSSPEKIGAFLAENGNIAMFREFGDLVDRVDEVLDDETRKIFNMRDSFVWFRVFNDFTKLGQPDERFNDFLKEFDVLKEKCVNGLNFNDLTTKNTKDKVIILRKVDYLEALMCGYLGIEMEEESDLLYGSEFETYVESFCELMDGIVNTNEKTAIKTYYALKGEEDLSDSHIQELIEETENSDDDIVSDFEDAIADVQDFIDDWVINMETDYVLKEDRIPALVRLYKYSVDSDVEGSRAQNWFINFADQESVNHRLIGNYKKDFETLKKAFDAFKNYENLGVA